MSSTSLDGNHALRAALDAPDGLVAPLVLDPLTARLAELAGFRAGYLGGGALGFASCCTEANLSLTQMVQAGVAIRAHASLPLILDGTCGWGDPVHVRHAVQHAEAAGFAAIEIEDQVLPKRVHHHVGVEHLVPLEFMAAKIGEAVAARRDRRFLVIARTNAARVHGLDDALRRAEAFHRCGADLLMVMPGESDHVRRIGERLPAPLAFMLPPGGAAACPLSRDELVGLGYKLVIDAATPLFAMAAAAREAYAAIRDWRSPAPTRPDARDEEAHLFRAAGLDAMLDVERRTVDELRGRGLTA